MTIRIRLFTLMAQHAGTRDLSLELPESATLSDAIAALKKQFPNLPWPTGTMLSINHEFASPDSRLQPGDEVAPIPPVSGG